jgi:hypothetical protein
LVIHLASFMCVRMVNGLYEDNGTQSTLGNILNFRLKSLRWHYSRACNVMYYY